MKKQIHKVIKRMSLLLALGAAGANAQTVQKANNTTALTTGSSWVGGSVPTSSGIGQWNSTVTAANTVALGGPLSLGEVQIVNPGGAVSLSDATAANILTLNGVNSLGLDLSSSTRSLTIASPLVIGANQTWKIATGQSVTLNGVNGIALGANVLTINGGTLNVNYSSTATTVASSSAGAGLVFSNTAVAMSAVNNGSSGTAGLYFGLNTALTLAGNNTIKDTAPATTGNHTQTFTALNLNPGVTVFSTGTRGSSSGISVGFTALNRNGGSMADVSGANNNTFGGSVEAYALPGAAVVGGITTGGTDWALPAGSATDLKTATYTNDAWIATSNTTVTTSSAQASATTGSLRFGAAGAATLTFSGLNTIGTGGILVNATVGANATTLTGGSLTSGNLNADGTSDLIVINDNSTAGSSIVINSVIADNGATSVGLTAGSTLAAVPTGSIQLNAANTFSGSTYITVGTLLLGNPLALQDSTFNTTTAGILSFGTQTAVTFGGLAGSGNLTLPAGFALTVGNNNKNGTLSGAILQSGSTAATLTKVGTGTLTLNGANTYVGQTTISAGTLALGTSGSFAGAASVSPGATLDVSASGNYSLASVLSGAGTINGSLTLAAGGQLAPTGSTGTLTLNNNLTLNGGTAVINFNGSSQHGLISIGGNLILTGGTVQVNNTGGALANGTYKIIGVPSGIIGGLGSVLSVSGFNQSGQTAALVANTVELDLVVSTYVAQNLTWVGDGAGLGTWNVNSDADWFDVTSSSTSVFHNGDNTTFNDTSVNPTVNLSATLSPISVTVSSVNNSYTFQGSGSIGGSATVADNNSGPLTVLTVNSYSGGTTIGSGATVNVGNGTVAGSLGTGPVVDNSTLTYDLPTGSQTQGAISGSGALNLTGTGTVVLNGADTLGGATTISSGTLKQGVANVLPNGGTEGNIVVNGTLDLAGLNGTVNQLTGNGTIDSKSVGVPVFTVTGGGVFGGIIEDTAGSLSLDVNGNGLTLEVTNGTYTGGTTVAAGTLQFGSATAIGGGSLTVGANGTADLNGFSPTIDFLSGAGIVDDVSGGGSVTLTVGNNNGNGTFSGVIQNSSGTVALTKAGSGTETLTGNNSYAGTTTVNGGTLAIATNGVIYSTTLAGNGFLVNGGTVNAGGTSTFNSSGNAFLETSGTVSVGTFAANANDGTLIEIAGGSFSANSVTMPRTAANTTAPTALAPIAAPTSSGFYVAGSTAVASLSSLTIATENSSASARVDAGSLTVNGTTRVGDQSGGRWDILQVNGGFFNDPDTANGVVIAGNDGANSVNAEVYLSGPSTNLVGIINFGQAGDTLAGNGWLFINGGASLYMGSGGIVEPNTKGLVATIELTSGLLGASASWASPLNMNMNGTNFTIQPADSSGNAYNIALSGVLTIGTNSDALTISGFPGGSGGTVFLSGANEYNGGTLVTNNATVDINGINALGGGLYDGLTLNGGTLQYTNVSNGSADLTLGTNGVAIGTLGGTIDVNGNSVTYANSLGNGGAGHLTVLSTSISNGVLNLLSPGTYTGGTTIGNNNNEIAGNGILSVNNTTGSATGPGNVTVAYGGKLTGNGIISGAVEIQQGGALAPGGSSLGTNDVGSLQLDSGAIVDAQFGGSANSLTVVTTTGGFVINDSSDNVLFNLYGAGSTAPFTTPGTYKLVQFSGTAPTLDSSWTTVSGSNPHVGNPQPSSVYSFAVSGGYLTVTVAGNGSSVAGIWTNPAGGNWTAAANWSSNPNVPHSIGDSATFGTATSLTTVSLNANETVGVLSFQNNNSFVIGNAGDTLTLDNATLPASIYALAGTANQIQAPVALNDSTTISVSSGQQLSISGVIGNAPTAPQSESLLINGSGTLVLAGNNAYGPAAASGYGTVLTGGGILSVANNNALAAGDVSVAGSSTLQAGAANVALPNNIDIASGATTTVNNNGQNLTLNGNITDSGSLTKTGAGTLTLNGNNSYYGNTTVSAGVLSLSAAGNVSSSPTIILNGGDLLGNGTFSLNPNIGIGATAGNTPGTALIDAASGQQFTVSGIIASAGNTAANNLVVNSGAGDNGEVILGGVNTFTGSTVVSNGVLDVQGTTALQDSTLNYNNQGGILAFDGGIAAATLGGLTGAEALAVTNLSGGAVSLSVGNSSVSNNYSGGLFDAGLGSALTKVGSATLTLSGSNSLAGNLTVNGGTLELPAGSYLSGNTLGGAGFLVDGGILVSSNAGTSTFGGGNAIVETGGAVVTPGTFRSSNNDGTLFAIFGGYFSAGTVSLQRTAANETAPTATGPIAAPTSSGLYIDSTNPGSPAVVDLGTLTIGTANSSCSVLEAAGTLTVTNEVSIGDQSATGSRWDILEVSGGTFNSLDTVNGIVIGRNNGANNNNGELYLLGGTTYVQLIAFGAAADTTTGSGDIIISGGSLYLGSQGIINANTTGSYQYLIALNSGMLGALGTLDITNALDLSSGNFTFQAADTNGVAQGITLAGTISGPGGLVKTGVGQLTLNNNADVWTGSTVVSNGLLTLVGSVGVSGSPTVSVYSPGTLDVSQRTDDTLSLGNTTTNTLSGNGTINGKLVIGTHGILAPSGTNGGTATLAVTGSVTLGGATMVNLNRANSTNSDRISSSSISAGGTLAVTNLGAALHAGDSFQLFSTAVSGSFAAVNLPTVDVANNYNYTWTNKLAIDGTIAVLTAAVNVNTSPTNITASVTGSVLTLSWPADHTGWRLQMETNSLAVGLNASSNSWTTVVGSTAVNTTNITINPAVPTVFYRLVYP